MANPQGAPATTLEISRGRPGCIIFLLDESASMAESFLGTTKSKADALAFAVNATLYRLVLQCLRGDEVYDYFHVGAIGYGGEDVRLALDGELAGLDLATLSQLAASPMGERTGRHGEPEPYWYVPRTSGMTPMCAAIDQATEIGERWVQFNPDSLAPIVLNVTDGQASDGHPRSAASRLTQVTTSQGAAMLFNLQLSAGESRSSLYPDSARPRHRRKAASLDERIDRSLHVLVGPNAARADELSWRSAGTAGSNGHPVVGCEASAW